MTSPDLAAFERLIEVFTSLDAQDRDCVEQLRPLYAPTVRFQDPLQTLLGVEEFLAMNRRLLSRSRELRFVLEARAFEGSRGFLTWKMILVPKLGPRVVVAGVTHVLLRDGLVLEHRDYWDLAELFASAIPGGRTALRWALKPLA